MAYAIFLLPALICIQFTSVASLTSDELDKFSSEVTLIENGDVYNFFSSGYPPHDIDDSINPNMASVQNFTYNMTIEPNNEGDQVWCTSPGPVGFATNGVAIYNALTGDTTDAVVYETFDDCKGHSSADGAYHYHQFPVCVGDMDADDEFIGIALDGNPIYGPKIAGEAEPLTSADLDACHGRFVDGKYRYHVTADFPYVIGCFKAEPARSQMGMGGQPGGDGQGPPPPQGGGGGMGRKRRQTMTDATCSNEDYGGELCDCRSGMLTQCDTLTGEDACEDAGETPTENSNQDDDDDENTTVVSAARSFSTAVILATVTLVLVVMFIQ